MWQAKAEKDVAALVNVWRSGGGAAAEAAAGAAAGAAIPLWAKSAATSAVGRVLVQPKSVAPAVAAAAANARSPGVSRLVQQAALLGGSIILEQAVVHATRKRAAKALPEASSSWARVLQYQLDGQQRSEASAGSVLSVWLCVQWLTLLTLLLLVVHRLHSRRAKAKAAPGAEHDDHVPATPRTGDALHSDERHYPARQYSEDDLYARLGVRRTASTAEIKTAFRERAKVAHPDKGGDAAAFQRLMHAFETLTNDAARRAYDREHAKAGAAKGWRAAREAAHKRPATPGRHAPKSPKSVMSPLRREIEDAEEVQRAAAKAAAAKAKANAWSDEQKAVKTAKTKASREAEIVRKLQREAHFKRLEQERLAKQDALLRPQGKSSTPPSVRRARELRV